jgi:GT2 family glycosyltransferase
VSVVVAAFNAAPYLNATLRSIRNQTHRESEVVVVVDGATDDTLAIAQEHARSDDRVRVIDLGRNLGRSSARNRGLSEASGDWVTVTDADDLWAADRLESMLDAARQFPDSSLITDDLIQFRVLPDRHVVLGHRDSTRATWRIRPPHRVRLREWYLDGSCPMNPMIRREFLEATGARYPERMSCGEDLCFQLELAFSPLGSHPVRVPRASYYYRSGESIRAANMAESRLLSTRIVLERTGSEEFARYARRATPGMLYRCERADRQIIAEGRAGPRDPDVDDIEIHSSRSRGLAQLVLKRSLKVAGDVADRRFRPEILADIESQLA